MVMSNTTTLFKQLTFINIILKTEQIRTAYDQ